MVCSLSTFSSFAISAARGAQAHGASVHLVSRVHHDSEVPAADLETLWRGYWTIENRKHDVRDVTLGEDAGQVYRGNAARTCGALPRYDH
jgi:predicted transposase YbfD/YdcC